MSWRLHTQGEWPCSLAQAVRRASTYGLNVNRAAAVGLHRTCLGWVIRRYPALPFAPSALPRLSSIERMTQPEIDQSNPPFKCGMEALLELVGGKWKLLILYHLHGGPRRFGELRRLVGNISEKVLSQQLKELAADGLIKRIDFDTVPPHVEYELTSFGHGLCATMKPACDWGVTNMQEIARIATARTIR